MTTVNVLKRFTDSKTGKKYLIGDKQPMDSSCAKRAANLGLVIIAKKKTKKK